MHGSHPVQCLRQAIRKSQLANCNLISIFYAIPLGLNLSTPSTHTAGTGSHTSCLVSCLQSAQLLADRTVFQFRNGRGPICKPGKGEQLLSGDGLTFFSCTNGGLCPPGHNGFRSIVFLTLLCSRKGCCNWPNQFPFRAERCRKSGFLTALSNPMSKECLMLAARTLYLKEQSEKRARPLWSSLSEDLLLS